jgi:hypothetical protein
LPLPAGSASAAESSPPATLAVPLLPPLPPTDRGSCCPDVPSPIVGCSFDPTRPGLLPASVPKPTLLPIAEATLTAGDASDRPTSKPSPLPGPTFPPLAFAMPTRAGPLVGLSAAAAAPGVPSMPARAPAAGKPAAGSATSALPIPANPGLPRPTGPPIGSEASGFGPAANWARPGCGPAMASVTPNPPAPAGPLSGGALARTGAPAAGVPRTTCIDVGFKGPGPGPPSAAREGVCPSGAARSAIGLAAEPTARGISRGSAPPVTDGSALGFAVGKRLGNAADGAATGAIEATSTPVFPATEPVDACRPIPVAGRSWLKSGTAAFAAEAGDGASPRGTGPGSVIVFTSDGPAATSGEG